MGFSLTTDLNIIDAHRQVNDSSLMSGLSSYPEIRFGYNQLAQGLLSPADLTETLVPLVINPSEIDYFLHNPESISEFCSSYLTYGVCSGQDGLNFSSSAILSDMVNFFEN